MRVLGARPAPARPRARGSGSAENSVMSGSGERVRLQVHTVCGKATAKVTRRTAHLSHPAPLASGMKQGAHRGVGCRCFVGPHFAAFRGSMTTVSSLFSENLTRFPAYLTCFTVETSFVPPTGNVVPIV